MIKLFFSFSPTVSDELVAFEPLIGLLCCLTAVCSAVPDFNATVKQFCGSVLRFVSQVRRKSLSTVVYHCCAVRYRTNVGLFPSVRRFNKSFVALWVRAHLDFAKRSKCLVDYSKHLVARTVEFLWRPRQEALLSFLLMALRVVVVYEAFGSQLFATEAAVPLKLRLSACSFCLGEYNFAVFYCCSCGGVPTCPDSSCCEVFWFFGPVNFFAVSLKERFHYIAEQSCARLNRYGYSPSLEPSDQFSTPKGASCLYNLLYFRAELLGVKF